MALAQETLRKVWDLKVQVCFRLASDQLYTKNKKPEQIMLDIPRHTYFPLVVENLRSHFAPYVTPELQKSDIRVEYSGLPLHMHYPVGVSFDLFAYGINLPWILTIRFESYVGREMLYNSKAGAVKTYYLDSVKAADDKKHKRRVFKNFKAHDRDTLWNGFVNNDFEEFWTINSKLMERTKGEFFKYIPFRIYQLDKCYIEELVRPLDNLGKERTMQDLINKFAPEILPYQEKMIILAQGIEIPTATQLQWLSEHFSYPDNFLHICIIPKT